VNVNHNRNAKPAVSLSQAGMRTLRMKPLEDTVSLPIEIPRDLYELAVRYQEALKDELGCETLN
jgi:hypothetical protein